MRFKPLKSCVMAASAALALAPMTGIA